jgi:hypothetical protein
LWLKNVPFFNTWGFRNRKRRRNLSYVGKRRQELFYSANQTVMSAESRTEANVESSIPKALFKFGAHNSRGLRFVVTEDGQRFVIQGEQQKAEVELPEISLVLYWAAEMKRP